MRTPRRVGYEELSRRFSCFSDADSLFSIPVSPRRRYGNVGVDELVILSAMTRSINPRTIFEFGRFDGLTTLCLAQSAPKAKVYTLDLPYGGSGSDHTGYAPNAPAVARNRWEREGVNNRIAEILMDSESFDPGAYLGGSLIGAIDLVFIDANHDYDHIRHDTDSALSMLSPGGVVIWHDYFKRSFPGVTAHLAELAETHEVFWVQSPGHPDYLETSLCYRLGTYKPGCNPQISTLPLIL